MLALAKKRHLGDIEPYFSATDGMLAFYRGNYVEGARLYETALQAFERRKNVIAYVDCLAYYARTAHTVNAPHASAVVQRAQLQMAKQSTPAASVILSTFGHSSVAPMKATLRRLSQWEFDPSKNTLIQRVGVTGIGAPEIVFTKRKYP